MGEEIRYWRNSFGLLGIILGIEFQLEHRDKLQMYTVTKKMDGWSDDAFWKFIKEDAEADVPDGPSGTRASWNGEYFVDWVNNPEKPTVLVYAQKANSSVDADFNGQLDVPENVEANYAKIMDKRVTDNWHGKMSWGEAARRDGAPPIEVLGIDVNDIFRGALEGLRGHGLPARCSVGQS